MRQNDNAIVFVVDDDFRVRESLQNLLTSLRYQVATFASAFEYVAATKPDCAGCLILDLKLPGKDGLQLQQELAGSSTPPIVFISGHGDIPTSVRAIKAGAIEFLTKPFSEEELLHAVDAAIELDREARQIRSELDALRRNYGLLTPRERQVLPFVVAGLLNKQTADELGTSEITVRVHRGQIMRKMKANSLAELVRMADNLGIAQQSRTSKAG